MGFRGYVTVPGRTRPVRHTLFFSDVLMKNGLEGTVYVLHDDVALIWSTVVSFLGLPAMPEWAEPAVQMLRSSGKLRALDGFGCSPVAVKATREEILQWIGQGVKSGVLPFPEQSGPIQWPSYGLKDLLAGFALPQAA